VVDQLDVSIVDADDTIKHSQFTEVDGPVHTTRVYGPCSRVSKTLTVNTGLRLSAVCAGASSESLQTSPKTASCRVDLTTLSWPVWLVTET